MVQRMEHVLFGARKLDFSGEDGRQVRGVQLWVGFESDNVIGMETAKLFVRSNLVPHNVDDYMGTAIDIEFNNKGKVQNISFPRECRCE
mgnify:CR=1 FL=1